VGGESSKKGEGKPNKSGTTLRIEKKGGERLVCGQSKRRAKGDFVTIWRFHSPMEKRTLSDKKVTQERGGASPTPGKGDGLKTTHGSRGIDGKLATIRSTKSRRVSHKGEGTRLRIKNGNANDQRGGVPTIISAAKGGVPDLRDRVSPTFSEKKKRSMQK